VLVDPRNKPPQITNVRKYLCSHNDLKVSINSGEEWIEINTSVALRKYVERFSPFVNHTKTTLKTTEKRESDVINGFRLCD
jgi:hypothetical protein